MRRRLRVLIVTVVGLCVVGVPALWLFQDRLIFHRKSYRLESLQNVDQQGGHRIEVVTSQGKQVAFYRPPRSPAPEGPVFLWFILPGRASLALDFWGHTGRWDRRFAYVFVDYPGYGCCEGQPSAEHIAESIAAIAARVRGDLSWSEREMQDRAGVLGHSLGCATALMLADQLKLKHAVLCAPFTSLMDMAQRTVGWPLCCIVGHQFDNAGRLASLTAAGAQVCVFHGMADHTIPFQMSQTLAARFPQAIRLSLIPECGHGAIVGQAEQEIGREMLGLAGLGNVAP